MTSPRKRTAARSVRKLKDLKSKKDPRGGKAAANAPTVTTIQKLKPTQTGWIEIDSFSFGASNP
jgi:hypothetical protein